MELAEQFKREEAEPHDDLSWITLEVMLYSVAHWRKAHYECMTESDWYSFETNRAKSMSDLIEWDMHLSGKNWFSLTNWSFFVLNLLNEQQNPPGSQLQP